VHPPDGQAKAAGLVMDRDHDLYRGAARLGSGPVIWPDPEYGISWMHAPMVCAQAPPGLSRTSTPDMKRCRRLRHTRPASALRTQARAATRTIADPYRQAFLPLAVGRYSADGEAPGSSLAMAAAKQTSSSSLRHSAASGSIPPASSREHGGSRGQYPGGHGVSIQAVQMVEGAIA
jgi:hypothetical protein